MTRPALLDDATLRARLAALPDWSIDSAAVPGTIVRNARFAGWLETLAFVHALGWLCHREDHHPDLAVGFDRVTVRFSTHSPAA
jgi:4a-hydroxytetrahydrobiopterin dehydratase